MGSGKFFLRSLRKYGKDNFKRETIETIDDNLGSIYLGLRETYWIARYDATNPEIGYNLAKDGTAPMRGFKFSQDHRNRLRISKTGIRNSQFGKKRSLEHRENLTLSLRGLKRSPEVKENMALLRSKRVESSDLRPFYEVISPSGDIFQLKGQNNLNKFSENFDIGEVKYNSRNTIWAGITTFKGWTIKRLKKSQLK